MDVCFWGGVKFTWRVRVWFLSLVSCGRFGRGAGDVLCSCRWKVMVKLDCGYS